MAGNLFLVFHGHGILAIAGILPIVPDLALAVAAPTLGQKPVGKFQVAVLFGEVIQAHQGQFDLLVTTYPGPVRHLKRGIDVVGEADGHIEEFALTGGVVVRDGGFNQVPGAVILVLFHVCPAFVEAGQRVVGIQIPVGQLGRSNLVDPLVGLLLNGRVGAIFQRIGHCFNGFVHVGVVVVDPFVRSTARLAQLLAGHFLEIADAARFGFGLHDAGVQRGRGHLIHLGLPELIADSHLGETHRLKPLDQKLSVGR